MANQEVVIYAVKSDPVEQEIIRSAIGRVTTNATGKYKFVYSPHSTGRYKAIAAKPDGTVIATSNSVEVAVQ